MANKGHGEHEAEEARAAKHGGGETHDGLLVHQLAHELHVAADAVELGKVDANLRGRQAALQPQWHTHTIMYIVPRGITGDRPGTRDRASKLNLALRSI